MTEKQIIKKISLDNYIPVVDIEMAVKYQFKFVREVIESATRNEEDTFKTVALPKFGRFAVPKGKIAAIIKKSKNKTKINTDGIQSEENNDL